MNTSDENDILRTIIKNIRHNKEKYNIDTKLVVLLNKCDDMSYNNKTRKYCLDNELKEMFDQADDIIRTTVSELYAGLKYHILPISCEDAYVYRMYENDPNASLDEKHLNKFGANEYGKSKWNAKSYEEKRSLIAELFKDFNYENRMEITGFNQFKYAMKDILNDENQYNYLLDHIKLDLQTIIYGYNKVNIENELDRFRKYYEYLGKLIEKFDKSLGEYKFLFNALDDFIVKYGMQFDNAFWEGLKPNKSVDVYCLIYKMYVNFRELFINDRVYIENRVEFNKLKKYVDDRVNEVLRYINIYWIEKMDNPNIGISELLSYFDKLYEHKYEILHELIVRKLSNVSFYTNIYNNHCYTDEIWTMLDATEKRYNFTKKEMITDLAVAIATNTYQMLINNKDFTLLNRLCVFWQNVVVKTSNRYYTALMCFKNTFKINVFTMKEFQTTNNIPCNYMSDYIIRRIKQEHPNDIATYDQLIDQLYFKQNTVIENSKKKVEVEAKSSLSKLDEVFMSSNIINKVNTSINITTEKKQNYTSSSESDDTSSDTVIINKDI
jgi:hypothetical protein